MKPKNMYYQSLLDLERKNTQYWTQTTLAHLSSTKASWVVSKMSPLSSSCHGKPVLHGASICVWFSLLALAVQTLRRPAHIIPSAPMFCPLYWRGAILCPGWWFQMHVMHWQLWGAGLRAFPCLLSRVCVVCDWFLHPVSLNPRSIWQFSQTWLPCL
jgi:hypothetical protein